MLNRLNVKYDPDPAKISLAIIFLAVTELALLGIVLVQALTDSGSMLSVQRLPAVIGLSALVVFDVVNAVFAYHSARRTREDMISLRESLRMVEQLNGTLRAQRHDFLNHLQVVSGLMQMGEYDDAKDYIGRVSGDVRSLSGVLLTRDPAVNALLQAKRAACAERGIAFEMNVTATLDELPLEDWKMCRVMSNLIDNAMEALSPVESASRVIRLVLSENDDEITLSVWNSGPAIADDILKTMFAPGVSTKGEGRGMGLSIVRETLREAGGDVSCINEGGWVKFGANIKKKASTDPAE